MARVQTKCPKSPILNIHKIVQCRLSGHTDLNQEYRLVIGLLRDMFVILNISIIQ